MLRAVRPRARAEAHRGQGFDIGTPIVVAFGLRLLAAIGLGQLSIARDLRGGDELDVPAPGRGRSLAADQRGRVDSTSSPPSCTRSCSRCTTGAFDVAPPELMLRGGDGAVLDDRHPAARARPSTSSPARGPPSSPPGSSRSSRRTSSSRACSTRSRSCTSPRGSWSTAARCSGSAASWSRSLPMVVGCLIAMATRPYVGWFLTAAAAAVVLHASLTRQRGPAARSRSRRPASSLIAAFIPVASADASSDEKPDGAAAVPGRQRRRRARTSRSSGSTTRPART